MRIGWIVGFVDGEGCFSIGFSRQPDRKEKYRVRRGYRLGYQVVLKFAVVQGASSKNVLEDLQKFFGVGRLYLNTRHDNHTEDLWTYYVGRRDDLRNVIIPFFKKYPLQTNKRRNFEKFCSIMELLEQEQHRSRQGLIKIMRIAATMNRKVHRKNLIRILRDYTPTGSTEPKI